MKDARRFLFERIGFALARGVSSAMHKRRTGSTLSRDTFDTTSISRKLPSSRPIRNTTINRLPAVQVGESPSLDDRLGDRNERPHRDGAK